MQEGVLGYLDAHVGKKKLSLNISLQPHKNSRWVRLYLKKCSMLVGKNIGKYFCSLDVRIINKL